MGANATKEGMSSYADEDDAPAAGHARQRGGGSSVVGGGPVRVCGCDMVSVSDQGSVAGSAVGSMAPPPPENTEVSLLTELAGTVLRPREDARLSLRQWLEPEIPLEMIDAFWTDLPHKKQHELALDLLDENVTQRMFQLVMIDSVEGLHHMYMSQPAELRPTYLSCRGQPYCTDHYTMLHWAALHDSRNTGAWLIRHSADRSVRTEGGETYLQIAQQNGCSQFLQVMKEAVRDVMRREAERKMMEHAKSTARMELEDKLRYVAEGGQIANMMFEMVGSDADPRHITDLKELDQMLDQWNTDEEKRQRLLRYKREEEEDKKHALVLQLHPDDW